MFLGGGVGVSPYLRFELFQIVRVILCHLPYNGVGDSLGEVVVGEGVLGPVAHQEECPLVWYSYPF